MEFRILGGVEVMTGGNRVGLRGLSERKLLAALLLEAGRVVPVSRLIDVMWDDDPPVTAAKQVRNAVSRLRQLLSGAGMPDIIRTDGTGYQLTADRDTIDWVLFEALVGQAWAAASAGGVAEAAGLLGSALGLWRGDALAGLPGQVVEAAAAAWNERRRVVAETYYDHQLALGRHREVLAELSASAAGNRLRGKPVEQLMLALYRCGRRADALAVYRDTRQLLAREMGLDPDHELQRLHQQILTGDQALELPRPGRDHAGSGPAAPSPDAAPHQLPAAPRDFTGRRDELQTLARLLDEQTESGGTVLISAIGGMPGIGKTALAVHWAHRYCDRFPDGQLYADLRGYDPDQPVPSADALSGFLRALGVPGRDIPDGEANRAARYRSLLAGQRVLVMLDNAMSAEQVRPLLPGCSSCAVVVTSRDALTGLVARDGARRLELGLLPPEDAAGLLRVLIGPRVDADPAAAAQLAAQCGRLPLALRVAAELAAARPGMRLAELTGELADEQRRLDLLDADGDPRTAIRAIFSWSCHHLDAAAARAFGLLGLHPGPDFDPYAAAALTGTSLDQARRTLSSLTRAHLVQHSAPDRYGLHDLLRAYARELTAAHGSQPGGRAALTRLFDHYMHAAAAAADTLHPEKRQQWVSIPAPGTPAPSLTTPAAARNWLRSERTSLMAVVAHMARHGWPGYATRLAKTLASYLEFGGHYAEAIIVHTHAGQAARQVNDRIAEADALTNLGRIHWQQGRCQLAADLFRQAMVLHREAGNRRGQAYTMNGLGLVDFQQGFYQSARSRFRAALALYQQSEDRDGQALALGNLGSIEARQGHYQQALHAQRQALAIFCDLGDLSGEGTTLSRLGDLALRAGRDQQAIDYQERSLAIFRDLGDRAGQAVALNRLGDLALRAGRDQQAIDYQERSLAIFRDLGDLDSPTLPLNGLGEIFFATGQPGQARIQHAAALGLASQTGDKYQQARAHDGLGRACHACGDAGQAHDHWRQALTLYVALGTPEADQVRARLTAAGPGQSASDRASVPIGRALRNPGDG